MRTGLLVTRLVTLSAFLVLVAAQGEVKPDAIDLTLAAGESETVSVSWKFDPVCFRAFNVDVIASDNGAKLENLSGVQTNGCGGAVSEFKVEITGTGEDQKFELVFVDRVDDASDPSELDSIPVTITATNEEDEDEDEDETGEVEELMGVMIRKNGITFQVKSSGCTSKEDFNVEVLESYPLQLRLIRSQPDFCDAYEPLGTRIKFNYRELGLTVGTQFSVINPLAVVSVPDIQ